MRRRSSPFGDRRLREELRQRLIAIPGLVIPGDALDRRPAFDLALLSGDDARAHFTDTLDWAFRTAAEPR